MADPGPGTVTSDTDLVTSSLIEQIGDIEEIRRLKHRCMRCIDLKQWEQIDTILTPDATFSSGVTVYGQAAEMHGAAAIVELLRARLGPAVLTEHILAHPEITVHGDTAVGIWSLRQKLLATPHRLIVESTGFCEEQYVRGSDRQWRIARVSYLRNFEVMMSLDDLPSFRLIASPESGAAAFPAAVADPLPDARG
jgi:hypothetical protein